VAGKFLENLVTSRCRNLAKWLAVKIIEIEIGIATEIETISNTNLLDSDFDPENNSSETIKA
jgi:hypothetical protein